MTWHGSKTPKQGKRPTTPTADVHLSHWWILNAFLQTSCLTTRTERFQREVGEKKVTLHYINHKMQPEECKIFSIKISHVKSVSLVYPVNVQTLLKLCLLGCWRRCICSDILMPRFRKPKTIFSTGFLQQSEHLSSTTNKIQQVHTD